MAGVSTFLSTGLYKWLRCELVHEAGLPIDIQFEVDDARRGLRAGGAPAFTLLLTTGWFHKLLECALDPLSIDGVQMEGT